MQRTSLSRLELIALTAAGAVAVHGAVILAGWWAGWRVLVSPSPDFIPMAPSTATVFFLLGSILIISLLRPLTTGTATAVAWLVAAVCLLNLVFPGRLDQMLGGDAGLFGRVRLGVMSPVTAGALLPLSLALALRRHRPLWANVGAFLTVIVGATIAVGYAHGTPLLYGSGTIPVALATGLSLLVLGTGTIAAAGPDVWPLRPLMGDSARARMLRAFVPPTALLLLGIGVVESRLGKTAVDPVLFSAWMAVAGLGLIIFLVSRLARRIGRDLEQAYADRHHAERRFREIFEQTQAGVATSGADGKVVLCNPAFAQIFGYESADQLRGVAAASLYWEASDRDRMLETLSRTGAVRNLELRTRRRDGSMGWILANVTRQPRPAGEATIESTVIDISDRKGLEQQLWQAQKLDALGSLAGGVAHDFNNVLTAITGYADLMLQDLAEPHPHREDVEEILKACERATGLTRQLLAFSRRQAFQPTALFLDRTAQDMEKMLQRLVGPTIRLVRAGDPDLPPIWADKSQIEQVILNLAVNSRDAMPQGGTLTIETRRIHFDEPCYVAQVELAAGSYVLLTVSDTGTGMDPDTLGHIFEPFFTTKERGKGTGLGLATVYGIVTQTRGQIVVYSEKGMGTTFKCYFPVTDEALEAVVMATPAAVRTDGRETVLVVEDEPAILAIVTSALERRGYRVLRATDGETAIRIAASHPEQIDLVLSDGVLSGVRVPELLRRMRAERPNTKILLMSGYSQEAVFQNELVDRSTAFLPKPFTARQLTTRVREVLDSTPPDSTRQ